MRLIPASWRRRWWSWARGARRAPAAQLSEEQRAILEREYDHWRRLTADERRRLERLIHAFLRRMRFEAARGFELDDSHRLLIAAQACVLLLGLDLDEYPATTSVILHPGTVMLHGRRGTGVGRVESSGAFAVSGQAHYQGPVLLSWPAVRSALRAPQRGQNVVYHEFAHQLDMLDGSIDGTPPLDDEADRARWIEVCTAAFDAVREPDSASALRAYAGTNPGEFFAVATEVFFTRPVALRATEPALYAELAHVYQQDPAGRFPEDIETTRAEGGPV